MQVKRNFDKILTAVLGVAIIIGLAFTLQHAQQGVPDNRENATALAAMPSLSFYTPDDKPVTLDDFRGRVVLVNLWATWCPPCVGELGALDSLQAKMKDKDFAVVAISLDRTSAATVESFLRGKDIDNLVAYWDKDRQVPLKWRYDGLPASFLLDRDGTVVERFNGPQDWDNEMFIARINEMLN